MSSEKRRYSGVLVRPIPFPLDHLPPKRREVFLRACYIQEKLPRYRGIGEFLIDVAAATEGEIEQSVESRLRAELRLQQEKKLLELARFFDLEPDKRPSDWKELALQLAIRHVSGFGTCQSNGAPRTGKLKDGLVGTAILWKLRANPGKSVSWASKHIKKDFPEISGMPKGIERAYYRWKKTAEAKRWTEMADSSPEVFDAWVMNLRKMEGSSF